MRVVNYCYVCNKEMTNRWVCNECCKIFGKALGSFMEFEDLPTRRDPEKKIPFWVQKKYDLDIRLDEGL